LQNNHLVDTVLVEEHLVGQEYATDWFVTNDAVIFVNGAKRVFDYFGIEIGYTTPIWLAVPERVQQLAEYAAKKLNISGGPFKIDWLYDERYGWCILECATRHSGGLDHSICAQLTTGRNLQKPLLDYALGLEVDLNDFVWQKHEFCATYVPKIKVTITPELIAKIKAQPGVVAVTWYGKQPQGKWQSGVEREIFIVAHDQNEARAWQKAKNAIN
jgi:hypothetical protein